MITGLSVSHRSASLDRIESVSPDDPQEAIANLADRESVTEALVLSTCNRVEWYVVTDTANRGKEILETATPSEARIDGKWLGHDASIEHLLRVAAGLESMVIGEDEILGQVRGASLEADAIGALGELLDEVVWKAIHLGERVRSETTINEGITSLGRAAVNRAEESTTLRGAQALVVGAGDMAAVAATAFADAGVDRLTIANRTPENAAIIAEEVSVEASVAELSTLPQLFDRADVAVTATASRDPIIDASILTETGRAVIVDLGQPRDVDPTVATVAGVQYFDLEDVQAVTQETNADRKEAAAAAEVMVTTAANELHSRLKRQQADEVIAAMYAGAEEIKRRELAEARHRVGDGNDPIDEVLSDFADALVGQLLAAPTKSLRDAAGEDDWETIQTALSLFDPAFPDGRVSPSDIDGEDNVGSSSAQR